MLCAVDPPLETTHRKENEPAASNQAGVRWDYLVLCHSSCFPPTPEQAAWCQAGLAED